MEATGCPGDLKHIMAYAVIKQLQLQDKKGSYKLHTITDT